MKILVAAENGFRFKGIWWTEETFTEVLQTVLNLHRAMNNHRLAFHFGVSEKAVRKLRARSQIADTVILCLMDEAKRSPGKPARYRGRDWHDNYPEDSEARKLLIAAEAERERQHEIRYAQRKQRAHRAIEGIARFERVRAQRRASVQRCKLSGLTQVLAAESLACSVRTVRRYW